MGHLIKGTSKVDVYANLKPVHTLNHLIKETSKVDVHVNNYFKS